ncbi:AraC family transcriptional regulator [Duganella sp. Leaf126]|nr:AraC family transcriptional regulator [Duganella sp. Leaf126]
MAHDADQLASALTDWQQRYDQVSAGRFTGALTERQLPQLQVFRESLNQAVRQSCRVWPDALWFGLPDHGPDDDRTTRINGRRAAGHTLLVRPGDVDFELVTPSAYSIYGIVASRRLLEQAARRHGRQIDWQQVQAADILQVDGAARAACLRMLAAALPSTAAGAGGGAKDVHGFASAAGGSRATGAGAGDAAVPCMGPGAWHDSVLYLLLDLLERGCGAPAASPSLQRRRRVVDQVRAYIDAHRDVALTVPQLCAQVHVSRRTLQYCFEEVLGMSPLVYMRMMRLNGARRTLLGQDQGSARAAVGDVADAWGMSNFSQFSSDYRKLFGQCPSAALRTRRTQ